MVSIKPEFKTAYPARREKKVSTGKGEKFFFLLKNAYKRRPSQTGSSALLVCKALERSVHVLAFNMKERRSFCAYFFHFFNS